MASTPVLHYILDPFCGWCYGAAPLVDAALRVPGLQVLPHAGGMLAGAQRMRITPQWRGYVMPQDQRVAQLTGQPYGDAYFDGLLKDTSYTMDSAPPITAMLAAMQLSEDSPRAGLAFHKRAQQAHWAEGRRMADETVLMELAEELDYEAAAFRAAFDALSGSATQQHMAQSRQLLSQVGGSGFPTFALQTGGRMQLLSLSRFLGQPEAFAQALAASADLPAPTGADLACGPDGCALP